MNSALMRPLLLIGVMCMLQACAVDAQEPTPKPNIILISLDTLRADRVGGPDGLTPNLDLLAQESWTFRKTYAQSTETLFSHASVFSGRYPSELSTVDYHFSYPDNIPTMAQVLRLYGYKTGGSVAGGHLSPAFGLGQGFDHYAGPEEWGSLWHTAPAALGWVDGLNNEPFFLFLHGYDTHSRYLKPSPVGYMYASMTPPGPGQGLVRSIHGTAQVVDGVWHRRRRFDQLVRLDSLRPHSTSARAKIQPDEDAISLQPVDLERIRKIYSETHRSLSQATYDPANMNKAVSGKILKMSADDFQDWLDEKRAERNRMMCAFEEAPVVAEPEPTEQELNDREKASKAVKDATKEDDWSDEFGSRLDRLPRRSPGAGPAAAGAGGDAAPAGAPPGLAGGPAPPAAEL